MRRNACTVATLALMLFGLTAVALGADEPRGLGRLFRFGNRGGSEARAKSGTPPREDALDEFSAPPALTPATSRREREGGLAPAAPGASAITSPYRGNSANPYGAGGARPAAASDVPPLSGPTDAPAGSAAGSRLVPQPRTSRPITDAPPILTRIQLGRSNDGHVFGMFLQVYADGTLIDTEGVHRVKPADLRPLIEALRDADVGRIKGHCGSPAVDFVEHVQLIVYDQTRGRIQANAFSYSGNMQGCDLKLQTLQQAIDALQVKIATPAPATAALSESDEPAAPPSVEAAPDDEAPAPPSLPLPDTNPVAARTASNPIRLSPVD